MFNVAVEFRSGGKTVSVQCFEATNQVRGFVQPLAPRGSVPRGPVPRPLRSPVRPPSLRPALAASSARPSSRPFRLSPPPRSRSAPPSLPPPLRAGVGTGAPWRGWHRRQYMLSRRWPSGTLHHWVGTAAAVLTIGAHKFQLECEVVQLGLNCPQPE